MMLGREDLLFLSHVAIRAAKLAGDCIQSYFGKKIAMDAKKAGSSPSSQIVTEVDFRSQALILNELSKSSPKFDFGLLTEEMPDDLSRFEKDYFWCIDPLDGTLPFSESSPGYAVSIALVSRAGTPHLGVVYDPHNQNLYHAIRGGGAFRNEHLWVLPPLQLAQAKRILSGGAVMNACWVLEKSPAYFNALPKSQLGGGCLWDYSATACIFHEIGAWVSDMSGNPLDLNSKESHYMNQKGVLFASHQTIARQIINT